MRTPQRNPLIAAFGIAALAVTIITAAVSTRGQSARAAVPRLAFEAASIKRNATCNGNHEDEKLMQGRVMVTCITLRNLIQAAYGTFASGPIPNPQRLQQLGAPAWVASNQYDIEATAQSDARLDQMLGPMLQTLLEDRFKLKLHRESRKLPVYLLSVEKGGLKVQRSKEGSCVPVDLSHANESSPNFCGRMTGRVNGVHITDDAYGMSMSEIAARFLSNRLDRPVIDKTGLKRLFDAHLEFDRDEAPSDLSKSAPVVPATGLSIFTAVQEQLGLKLSAGTGPVEVLVIDHVEEPTKN